MSFLLLLMFLELRAQAFYLMANYTFVNSTGSPAPVASYDSSGEYMITEIMNPSNNQLLIFWPNLASTPVTFTTNYAPIGSTYLFNFRAKYGTPIPLVNCKSIAFHEYGCSQFIDLGFSTPYASLNSTGSVYIKECVFSLENTNYLVVFDDTTTSQIAVSIYDSSSAQLGYSYVLWNSYQTFIKAVQRNGLFYLFFQDGIYICDTAGNLPEIARFTWPLDPNSAMDISFNCLAYSFGSTVSIYNISNSFALVSAFTLNSLIFSIKVCSASQILILAADGIYQYSMINSTQIWSYLATFSPTDAIDIIMTQYLVVYAKYPHNKGFLLMYDLNGTPSSSNTTNATNTTNTTNTTNPINTTNTINQTNTKNATNTTIPVNTTNTTNNTNSSSSLSLIEQTQAAPNQYVPSEELPFLNQILGDAKKVSENVGAGMHISSLKAAANSIMMFMIILDDLEYYQYHKINYTQSIQFTIINVNALNTVRFDSWFLKDFIRNDQFNRYLEYHEALYKGQYREDEKSPSSFYFLNSARPAYVDSFIMCIFSYLCMKALHGFFYAFRNKHILCMAISKKFRRGTKWWMLLAAILENNMASLAFDVFVQLQGSMVSSFEIGNKINLIATVIILFSLIFYSFCFYLLIYVFSKRKAAKNLLNETSYGGGSFFWESFCRITRNLIRCFFHGFFIFKYKMQILGLAWSNLIYIIATVVFRKSFTSKINFLLYLLYYLVYFTFDLGLLLHYLIPHFFTELNLNFNLSTFIMICTLVGIFFSLIIFSILRFIFGIAIKLVKKKADAGRNLKQDLQKPVIKVVALEPGILIPAVRLNNKNKYSRKNGQKLSQNNPKAERSIQKSSNVRLKITLHYPQQKIVPLKKQTHKNSKFGPKYSGKINRQDQKQNQRPKASKYLQKTRQFQLKLAGG